MSSTLDMFSSTSLILKKPMRSIPAGRPRRRVEAEANDEVDDLSHLLSELKATLDVKKREEEQLHSEIATLLSESATVSAGNEQSRSFGLAVSRLNNSMLVVETEANQLASSLKTISKLADSISGKVSSLDVAKTRVVECLQLASDMLDLGVCSEGVDEAIQNEEFEQAAQHIHRFLTLDKAVFQLRDSNDKEASHSVRHSYDILTNASKRLKEILEEQLDKATADADVVNIQRFARLFPLVGEHENGLKRLSVYLGGLIDKLGEDNIKIMDAGGTDDKRVNVLFADTLFLFFEGVAGILETNQPLVENSYGTDRLLDFISLLQKYVDTVVGKVLESFSKKRQLERRTRAVNKILRTAPANVNKEEQAADPLLNPLDLDVLLSELVLMNTHAEMYWKFVRRRIGDTVGSGKNDFVMVGDDDDFEELNEDAKRQREEEKVRRKQDREKKLDKLLNGSVMGLKMQELLGQYILLEQHYMNECVDKAVEMDQREDSLTSSVIDDVLFITRKCVRRGMNSGSIDAVCATLNNGVTLLETTFYQHLQAAIKTGYPTVGFAAEALQTAQTAYNVIQHGKSVTEAGPEMQKEVFLTAVNNARGAGEKLGDLAKVLTAEWNRKERGSIDAGKWEHSIGQIDEVVRKMAGLSTQGVDALCLAAFRPKLKTSFEQYIDHSHCLTETQFAEFEAVDPFIENFNANLDKMLANFEPLLLKENYQTLLLSVCTEVVKQFERVLFKSSFNRLGGLQLDREFRTLSGYLSGVAGWTARERCSRLAQIVSLLNVETVNEATDLWQAARTSSFSAPLSPSDAKKVLLLRTDIPQVAVNQLDLH